MKTKSRNTPPTLAVVILTVLVAALMRTPTLQAALLYTADFEGAIGAEWSTNRVSVTPIGGRKFLGDFGNNTVTLSLTNLSTNTPLTLEFDLFVLRTWDGNSSSAGPDLFRVDIGPTRVLNTTFKQPGSLPRQSYPSNYLSGEHAAMTGAREINSLGYNSSGTPMNSVYHLSFAFVATNAAQTFMFSALNLEGLNNESWGIDNVVIADGTPPSVAITAPGDRFGLNPPANILVTASATDPDGTVTNVTFFTNGVFAGAVTVPPYELALSSLDVGVYRVLVEAADNTGLRNSASAAIFVGGLQGEYYSAKNRTGTRQERSDPEISFSWDTGFPPIAGFPSANYSIRWTGELVPAYSEIYTFFVRANDRAILYINGVQVLECDGNTSGSGSIALAANEPASLQLDFENDGGASQVSLEWESDSQPRQVIPQARLRFPSSSTNRRPNAPSVIVPAKDSDFVHTSNVTFRTAGFSDSDSTNVHAATDWEVWSLNPTGLVWAAYGQTGAARTLVTLTNGTFQGAYAGRTDLPLNQHFSLRVRHKDNSGAAGSEWSAWAERKFHTLTPLLLIHGDSLWRFLDSGVQPPENWNALNFNDSSWSIGRGEFGYGDTVSNGSDARTDISFGSNAANKFTTTYFRSSFDVREPMNLESVQLSLICDDGAIVYLNGVEIHRQKMATGSVGYASLALAEVPNGQEEYGLTRVAVSPTLVLTGMNVLAAEVHLAASNSPDLSFHAELCALRFGLQPAITLATSDFQDNNESWSVTFNENNGENGTLYRFGIGGNPGGHLAYYDDGDSQSTYFSAPAKFRGNLLAAYGGVIELDTKVSSLGRGDQILRLHGGNLAIKIGAPYIRRTTWMPFRIRLDESANWRLTVTNKGSYGVDLGPATRNDILAVLSNVTALLIHGEAYGTQDESYLDNVRITAAACDEPAMLTISSLSNNLIAVQWPANRSCLQLEASSSIASGSWATNFPIISTSNTGGLRTTVVNANGVQFFRLRRN
jgi:hypothetical protein